LHEAKLAGAVTVGVVEAGDAGIIRLDVQVDLGAAEGEQAALEFGESGLVARRWTQPRTPS
jgi:hypothetical protein